MANLNDLKNFRNVYDTISRSLLQSQKKNRQLVEEAKLMSQKVIQYSTQLQYLANEKRESDSTIKKLTEEIAGALSVAEKAAQQEIAARSLTKKLKLEFNKMKLEINELHRVQKVLEYELRVEREKNSGFTKSVSRQKSDKQQQQQQQQNRRSKRGKNKSEIASSFANDPIRSAAARSGSNRNTRGNGGIWDKAMKTKRVLPESVKHMSHLPTPMAAAKKEGICVQYSRLPSLQPPYQKGHSFGKPRK
eukprot:g154.t1